MRRRIGLFVLLLGLLLPASALAASGSNPDQDCQQNGKLTAHYSVAELRAGLASMSLAERQYTSCQQIITDQLYAEQGRKGNGSGGGSSDTGLIVIIVVVVVILAGGGGAAFWAYRRNQGADDGPGAAA
jgi:hypothetical protein